MDVRRDDLGRPTCRQVKMESSGGVFVEDVQAFTYDGAGRMKHRYVGVSQPSWSSVTAQSLPQVYSGDMGFLWSLTGTRQQVAYGSGHSDSFGYNTTEDMVLAAVSSGTHTMGVDEAGNRQIESFGAETIDYQYDMAHRLTDAVFADGSFLTRRFDPLGRCVEEVHQPATGSARVRRWYYDGQAPVIEVEVADGAGGVQETLGAFQTFAIESAAPLLVHRFSQGVSMGRFWGLTDMSGSVRSVVDDGGQILQHYRYPNAFGLVEGVIGTGQVSSPLDQLPVAWPHLYKGLRLLSGNLLHGKTLYHAGGRVFDSETASYLQRNPWSPTSGKGDTPSSDLSLIEGSLPRGSDASGPGAFLPAPPTRRGGGGLPPGSTGPGKGGRTTDHPSPMPRPKAGGPGVMDFGPDTPAPHRPGMPSQPGGSFPGGSTGSGGATTPERRAENPGKGSSTTGPGGTRSTSGVTKEESEYTIPFTREEIEKGRREFETKNPGVRGVIAVVDEGGDLLFWGRTDDGGVIAPDLTAEQQRFLETLLPPDSRDQGTNKTVTTLLSAAPVVSGVVSFLGPVGVVAGIALDLTAMALEARVRGESLSAGDFGRHLAGFAIGHGIGRIGGKILAGAGKAAKGGALVVRNTISRHAAEQLAKRGITRGMVDTAIRRGTQYYDRMYGTISHVLEGGMASGKTLQIATDPATGNVVTGIIRSRFNPNVLLPNGTPRFVPIGQ